MTRGAAAPSRDVRGWVLYDGSCGICSNWVLGLGTRALQDPGVLDQLGLDEATALREIQLLFTDGRRLAGPEVIRFVLRSRKRTLPLYALSVPATHRRRLPRLRRATAADLARLPPRAGGPSGGAGCGRRPPLGHDRCGS
jgi:hypothetical protein